MNAEYYTEFIKINETDGTRTRNFCRDRAVL
jgi:hypothetical protein